MQSLFGVYDRVKKEVVYLYVANNCEEAGRIFKKSLAGNEDNAAYLDLVWMAYFDSCLPALYSDYGYNLLVSGSEALGEESDVLTLCRQNAILIPSEHLFLGDTKRGDTK